MDFNGYAALLSNEMNMEAKIFQEHYKERGLIEKLADRINILAYSIWMPNCILVAQEKLFSGDYVSAYDVRDSFIEALERRRLKMESIDEKYFGRIAGAVVSQNGGIDWLTAAFDETILRGNELIVACHHDKRYRNSARYQSEVNRMLAEEKNYLVSLLGSNTN